MRSTIFRNKFFPRRLFHVRIRLRFICIKCWHYIHVDGMLHCFFDAGFFPFSAQLFFLPSSATPVLSCSFVSDCRLKQRIWRMKNWKSDVCRWRNFLVHFEHVYRYRCVCVFGDGNNHSSTSIAQVDAEPTQLYGCWTTSYKQYFECTLCMLWNGQGKREREEERETSRNIYHFFDESARCALSSQWRIINLNIKIFYPFTVRRKHGKFISHQDSP